MLNTTEENLVTIWDT